MDVSPNTTWELILKDRGCVWLREIGEVPSSEVDWTTRGTQRSWLQDRKGLKENTRCSRSAPWRQQWLVNKARWVSVDGWFQSLARVGFIMEGAS